MQQNLSSLLKQRKIISYILIITAVPFFGGGKSDQNSSAGFSFQNNFHLPEDIIENQKTHPLKVDTNSINYADIISTRVICKQQGKYIGWPSITKTRSGELLVVFSGNRDAHVCPFGITQMIRSTDNGETWSDPDTINNTPLDDRDAGILETKNGWLLVSYGVRQEPYGEKACISKNGGETWETEKEIMINPAINSDMGYPASIQLDDGSILTVYYQIDKKGEKNSLMNTHWRLKEACFSSEH